MKARIIVVFLILFSTYTLKALEEKRSKNITAVRTSIEFEKGELLFLQLISTKDTNLQKAILKKLDENWQEYYEILLLDSFYFSNSTWLQSSLAQLFKKKTPNERGNTYDEWLQYVWNKTASYPPKYFEFKASLHRAIDSRFVSYFSGRSEQSLIRLDEVRWGGVLQDGIPPLRQPKMIAVAEASYLEDGNIVFGIVVNGEARAYPKRILAWHEMFVDNVGGIPVAGVYCTLCGTVILYKTEHEGTNHELGTSGFLYRSNKLMYDKTTQSLWSTLEGKPVIGPLVDQGIELEYMSVVTTTWAQWKKLHPETTVLSLNTGYERNYDEGVAYQDYFATDQLMFTVPQIDNSLSNKDEILAVRLPGRTKNFAIASKFLKKNPIFQSSLEGIHFTVFTDGTGAHRTYFTKGHEFQSYDQNGTAHDKKGGVWKLSEEQMMGPNGVVFERFPTHNAFWFGYKAAFPKTELIK